MTEDLSPEAREWEPLVEDDESDEQYDEPDESEESDEADEPPAEPESEPNDTTLPEPVDADGFLGVGEDNPWL
ncbi:hypothetical protein D3C77_759270 [compost metagenome]